MYGVGRARARLEDLTLFFKKFSRPAPEKNHRPRRAPEKCCVPSTHAYMDNIYFCKTTNIDYAVNSFKIRVVTCLA